MFALKAQAAWNTLRQSQPFHALIVNLSSTIITLKHGLGLNKCLVFDAIMVTSLLLLFLPSSSLLIVNSSPYSTFALQSLVKIVDFPEIKSSLIQTLEEY